MDEKSAFATRLKQALRAAAVDARSPTRLAVEFNLRYYGSPVSTQAVRKWLEGRAIPTQDKIRALGKWLEVSSEWLRFGESDKRTAEHALHDGASVRYEASTFPQEFARLTPRQKELVRELIHSLLAAKNKKD